MKPALYISLATILCLYACGSSPEPAGEQRETFVLSDIMLQSTRTEPARVQQLRNELRFYGSITADNNKLTEVYPAIGGNVLSVNVELGDYVKKGQLLATIRSAEAAGYEKELSDAENDVMVAHNNWKIARELFNGKLNTERDVIEARSLYDKAVSQLNRMKETFAIYSIRAGAIYEIRSPMNGFIIEKNINQDMLLRSDRSDNIFDIAEIDEVWAIANVNEADINQVKLGVDAFVTTLTYPDKVYTGKVDKIFNIIDPETKAMKMRVKLHNEDFLLKPQMRANIRIAYTEDRSMVSIPSSALIFDKSRNFVMVFKNRYNIETRQVEVYRQLDSLAYITSGLSEGEKVITSNQLYIYDAIND